jgi:hypothetical protein
VGDKPRTHSGLSIKTLLIAGAASATAAYLVPMFWRPGTVFAAAMTPVIVTVVSELLNRPADTVSKVSKVASRRTTGGAVVFEEPPPRSDEPFDPLAPPPTEELEALPQTATERAVHRRGLTGRQWRVALITAAIAFAGAVTFVTASELLAGETTGSSDNPTTFFSRNSNRDSDATPTPTATPSATPEEEEATSTPTPTPSATTTATPTPTATPTATPTPATVAPQSTAPASPTPTP